MDLSDRILTLCASTMNSLSVPKEAIRMHNRAMRELHHIKKALYRAEAHGVAVVRPLLENPDERVLIYAASYCLEADLLLEKAREVLTSIRQQSPNSLHRMNAFFTLMLTPRKDW